MTNSNNSISFVPAFTAATPANATHFFHSRLNCIFTREVAAILGVEHDAMLPLVVSKNSFQLVKT